MAAKQIDVWDVCTFDSALVELLKEHADLIRDYLETDHQIFLSHDLGRGPSDSILRPENPYASGFNDLRDVISQKMQQRTIRAFHYTRLTDGEVAAFMRDGVHLSTRATLQRRFDEIVAAGGLLRDVADQLYAASPFHSDQLEVRSGRFWVTSHPIAVDSSGVQPLIRHWGGEVASMWARDEALTAPLASLGKPRIIELAVPMSATRHSYSVGAAVVATFARSRGFIPSKPAFDLSVEQPLTPAAVLAVHTEGDLSFKDMGRGYPVNFIDVDIGRWTELTGEEE